MGLGAIHHVLWVFYTYLVPNLNLLDLQSASLNPSHSNHDPLFSLLHAPFAQPGFLNDHVLPHPLFSGLYSGPETHWPQSHRPKTFFYPDGFWQNGDEGQQRL